MKPLEEMNTLSSSKVKALLFDLDGTFVGKDYLKSTTYRSLEQLHLKGIKTIAVTGRPAGWCDLMARWWPIDGVVGENGALFYYKLDGKIARETFHDYNLLSDYQEKLKILFSELSNEYEFLKLASDQSFRHWDIAVDIAEEAEVSLETAEKIVFFCKGKGAEASISNIHVNIWFGHYNKKFMTTRVLEKYGLNEDEVVFIGDSPNDSPLFDYFSLSVGVNSVKKYGDIMSCFPKFICSKNGEEGFVELVDLFL